MSYRLVKDRWYCATCAKYFNKHPRQCERRLHTISWAPDDVNVFSNEEGKNLIAVLGLEKKI